MNEQQIEQAILGVVSAKNYQPVKPRRIARQLNLDDDDTRLVKRIVKRLVRDGRLTHAADHAVCLPSRETSNRVTGIYRRMQDGYGFVRPSGTSASSGRDEDVYVPQRKGGDAATGDLVQIQVSHRRGGKPGQSKQGVVVKVLERKRMSLSVPTLSAVVTGWCGLTVVFSKSRFWLATLERKASKSTTKSSSRWSGFPRTSMMAKR